MISNKTVRQITQNDQDAHKYHEKKDHLKDYAIITYPNSLSTYLHYTMFIPFIESR